MVVWPGAPLKKGKPVLPEALHKIYASMGGFQKKLMAFLPLKAAGLLLVTEPALAAMIEKQPAKTRLAPDRLRQSRRRPRSSPGS